MEVQFTRQELYEKVWALPMVHVGAEHGVSGNAIKNTAPNTISWFPAEGAGPN